MAASLIMELHKKSSSMESLSVHSTGQHTRPQSISCDPSVSRPILITTDDYGGSNENGVNLVGYRQLNSSNTRWHSDTNLASNPYHSESRLSVNKTEVDINNEQDSVTIHWDIKASVSAKDWIGLYRTDQAHPGKWLDYRNRGVSGSKKGELVWHFDRIASAFTQPETRVCFRYYYGNTGDLRAVTEPILVRNSSASTAATGVRRLSSVDSGADIVHLAIHDVEAIHVRKGMFFNPDPYVKIRIEPGQDRSQPVLSHHYKDTRTSVCENTTEPRWHSEIFHFMALPSDSLFMKVKDRFTSARPTLLRFLGQVSLPVKHVVEKAKLGLTVNCQLIGRTPHDHVCGTLIFKPTIIPHDASKVIHNGDEVRENGRVCCSITDSSVENVLDRSSADILSDSSDNSDDEGSTRPTVRELTHTYSGTSGDSSIDAVLENLTDSNLNSTTSPQASNSTSETSSNSLEEAPRSDVPDIIPSLDGTQHTSFTDPLTAYQFEDNTVPQSSSTTSEVLEQPVIGERSGQLDVTFDLDTDIANEPLDGTSGASHAADNAVHAVDENVLVTDMSPRATAETSHATGEAVHATDETVHATDETSHATGETVHATAEKSHATAEKLHATDETVHATGETSHATGEKLHATEETVHATAETSHATGEALHATDETVHATDETSHATDETSHATDETLHATDETDETVHATGDTKHVTGEALHVAEDTLHVTEDTLRVTEDTLHVTEDTLHVTEDTLQVVDETGHGSAAATCAEDDMAHAAVKFSGERTNDSNMQETGDEPVNAGSGLPPPDFPPPSLPVGDALVAVSRGPDDTQEGTEECAARNPSLAECTMWKAGSKKSASVWSLENHAGSQENIFEAETSSDQCSPTQPPAEPFAAYQNMSDLVGKAKPPTPDVDASAKEKPPLPQPRIKTLAEQLDNLQVIESEAATYHRHSLPPELPHKAKESVKAPPADAASKRRTLESEGSLEMPAGPAPVPPGGARPKRVATAPHHPHHAHHRPHHHQVAELYGTLDAVDAKPKIVKTEEPPVLKPRKGRTELPPPRLPPRNRQKADGSTQAQTDNQLDEVFEPAFSSRQHPKHHKPKVRPGQPAGTESEEARVAAEVANAAASLTRPHKMKSESIEVEEALPKGWEARVDAHGRVFYIDHNNRSTTWERPTCSGKGHAASHQRLQRVPSISNSDKANMDKRYRSIIRMSSADTISEGSLSPPRHIAPPPPNTPQPQSVPQANTESQATSSSERSTSTPAPSEGAAATATPSTSQSQPAATAATDAETRLKQEVIRSSPAVKFLTRTDFFSLVQYSDEAQVCYTSNSQLKHMVHKIRKDPTAFHKYCHNKDLVNFLNMFVNKDEELPGNWQMKHDKTGKVFFLDHSTKTTTFIDPRLPIVQPPLNPGTQLPLRRNKYRVAENSGDAGEGASNLPTAYDEKVVIFLRQPNILALLQERYPLLKKNESLKNKITTIISDGTMALKKYRNHVELTILLSMFENEIMSFVPAHLRAQHDSHQTSPKGSPAPGRRMEAPPHKKGFQDNYRAFLRKLEAKGIGQGPGKTKMRVQRDRILEDSFKKIMSYSKKDLQKNKLLISFLGEEGLDYGGPAREFFFLLSRELFNPYYGLFEYSANDTYTVQISPMSAFVDNAAEWFRFAGRMIGLCIVHQFLMDSFFTRPFYKMLLRETCDLTDLESLDAEFHQSLLWIKDNDISEAGLDLTFSVDEEVFGQVMERELKPNGKNIAVTNKNKHDYVERMVSWRIDRGVNEQKEHLLKGFYEVIEPKMLNMFDAKDLELVIAGTAEIDIVDWRNNTEYRSGYYDTHPIVDWFWELIESFNNELRLRLLQFVTGTSSIPFEGFSALRGSNGPRKFTIEKWGTPESLPRAHTCFNRLDLPSYTCKDTMEKKLVKAISMTGGFGIE